LSPVNAWIKPQCVTTAMWTKRHSQFGGGRIGEMGVPDAGVMPANRKHAVEFGLPVADQNHANSFIILREA
jgi:hypothetical protein